MWGRGTRHTFSAPAAAIFGGATSTRAFALVTVSMVSIVVGDRAERRVLRRVIVRVRVGEVDVRGGTRIMRMGVASATDLLPDIDRRHHLRRRSAAHDMGAARRRQLVGVR